MHDGDFQAGECSSDREVILHDARESIGLYETVKVRGSGPEAPTYSISSCSSQAQERLGGTWIERDASVRTVWESPIYRRDEFEGHPSTRNPVLHDAPECNLGQRRSVDDAESIASRKREVKTTAQVD
ncbi:hypothetical protein AC579_5778 [Pseudocercospora musae]|uniref:Uncharacterized protein n=1 Tax=Pseudocercospora musae TaxID=113226 RepID=A0A139IR23_9PEZI|nr:hypothetical protein AC579_5778 [Pseudocercospora musae]